MKKLISFLILMTAISCVSLPETLKKKGSADLSIIAISFVLQAPIAFFSKDASEVLFVKLADPKDKKATPKVFQSNFTANGYVYLINAEPGTYTVILAGAAKQNQNDTPVIHYLDNESIAKISIKVNKNEFVYAGRFTTSSSQDDVAWSRVDAGNRTHSLSSTDNSTYARSLLYAGFLQKVESTDADKQRLIGKAKEVFNESEWASIIK
ncbi:hypothetical protein [Leptospira stimsonii]|uniref:DUF2846 domain-containing protein n=1 Tax=Leptospira stimsonii TaxID=2202203 RepID=A0ABY2MY22_9LEPT|nr:hypothetical protein [Leptospira stimsonii]TGK14321.1 hypothetical protein EHO98_15655 [Leptospira stimsonii]TGM11684.1 hypothetical protein EHQ90_15830 [Leptospira stimsonii]